MNILSEENITSSALVFLIFGGLITFWGSLVVYSQKRLKSKKKHERK